MERSLQYSLLYKTTLLWLSPLHTPQQNKSHWNSNFFIGPKPMTTVPACGIMINVVAPKWNSIWALSYIAKCWPVKTAIKRKKCWFISSVFSYRQSICDQILWGQMAPKLHKNILVLSLYVLTLVYDRRLLQILSGNLPGLNGYFLTEHPAFVVCPYGGGYYMKVYLFIYILTTGSI